MTTPVDTYDGPIGSRANQLIRRRIAVARDRTGHPYLVRSDSVIIEVDPDDDHMEQARARVGERGLEVLGEPSATPATGILGARIRPDLRPTPGRRWTTDVVNGLLEQLESDQLTVRPNHVYMPDGIATVLGDTLADSQGPALTGLRSTARPALAPTVWRRAAPVVARVPHVLVLDTGLRTTDGRVEHEALDTCRIHTPWLTRTAGRFNDEDEPDDDGAGLLDRQAGHGTFISGIIRWHCPEAVIHHAGVLSSYGDGDDASVAAAIDRVIERTSRSGEHIDVVVASFGAYGDEPPPMAAALARLMDTSVVVAAAGNDATCRPFYPAALANVVAVGALGSAGRAPFSNFGSWVDACAIGTDVVSTFFAEFADHDDDAPGRVFRGWASWSGTSFAAPVVAAAIARGIARTGGSARDTWQAMSSDLRRLRLADLGIVVGDF